MSSLVAWWLGFWSLTIMAWSESLVWKCSHKLQWRREKKKKSGSICFERIQDILPQISDYGILIIFESKGTWENSRKRLSLTCLDFLQTDPAKWTHLSLMSSLGISSTIGGWLLSQKRKLEVCFTLRQLCHKLSYFPSVLLRAHSSFLKIIPSTLTSLVAQMVKRLPTIRETWVRPLGWEDPLEKEMATHSSILAWKIPWMEEPDRLQSMGYQRVGHNWATSLTHSLTLP